MARAARQRPMEGINAYSRPSADGGITVDSERMLVDLITVLKASGATKESFLEWAAQTFDAVEVEIRLPSSAKN
jgi:hypothetical protein